MKAQTETKHTAKVSHTPGPWEVFMPSPARPSQVSVAALNGCVTIYDAPYTTETEANAHLISAAPEMLAELCKLPCAECGHDLIRHLDKYGCEYDRGDRQVQDVGAVAIGPCSCNGGEEDKKLIDLIRKAKGEL